MDDQQTRDRIRKHGAAAVRGDMDALAADFVEELRPQLPQIAAALPQPVTAVEVVSVDMGGAESVATVRYSGDSGELTVRQLWQDVGGRPMIVHAEPVA